MENTDQIETLRAKHATLETEIETEFHSANPDDLRIQQLKREKLKIKDEIATLEHL